MKKIDRTKYKNTDIMCLENFKNSILTEKSVRYESEENTLCFFIKPSVTKTEIRLGIEGLFKEKALSVRIINTKSRIKTFKGRKYVSQTHKKVMIRMKSIESIREVLNVK